jgi:hypothetical protein
MAIYAPRRIARGSASLPAPAARQECQNGQRGTGPNGAKELAFDKFR